MAIRNVGIAQKVVTQHIKINGAHLQIHPQAQVGPRIFIDGIAAPYRKHPPQSFLVESRQGGLYAPGSFHKEQLPPQAVPVIFPHGAAPWPDVTITVESAPFGLPVIVSYGPISLNGSKGYIARTVLPIGKCLLNFVDQFPPKIIVHLVNVLREEYADSFRTGTSTETIVPYIPGIVNKAQIQDTSGDAGLWVQLIGETCIKAQAKVAPQQNPFGKEVNNVLSSTAQSLIIGNIIKLLDPGGPQLHIGLKDGPVYIVLSLYCSEGTGIPKGLKLENTGIQLCPGPQSEF